MKASKLKVGDRIRLTGLPGERQPDYYMHRDTRQVYKKLLARNRPVRISEVDEFGPWFECRFRGKDGRITYHFLVVADGDDNWVKVP